MHVLMCVHVHLCVCVCVCAQFSDDKDCLSSNCYLRGIQYLFAK